MRSLCCWIRSWRKVFFVVVVFNHRNEKKKDLKVCCVEILGFLAFSNLSFAVREWQGGANCLQLRLVLLLRIFWYLRLAGVTICCWNIMHKWDRIRHVCILWSSSWGLLICAFAVYTVLPLPPVWWMSFMIPLQPALGTSAKHLTSLSVCTYHSLTTALLTWSPWSDCHSLESSCLLPPDSLKEKSPLNLNSSHCIHYQRFSSWILT